MARMLFLLGALVTVAGCSSSPSANNALLGRTRIPAPSTGSISNTAASDPAYRTSQTGPSAQPAATDSRAMASMAPASSPATKPVAQDVQPKVRLAGDRIAIPSEARRATALAESRPPRREIAPASNVAPASARLPGPATQRENRVIEISSLPSLDRSAQSAVRIPTEAVAETQLASHAAPSRYGYAEDYSRLAGRLEHIQATNQWKLRYIQIDGHSDDFGGSVILSNPRQLAGLKPGDYVHVEGRISADATTEGQFAPEFAVARIARQ